MHPDIAAGWKQSYFSDLFAFSTVKAKVFHHAGPFAVARALQVPCKP